LTVRWG